MPLRLYCRAALINITATTIDSLTTTTTHLNSPAKSIPPGKEDIHSMSPSPTTSLTSPGNKTILPSTDMTVPTIKTPIPRTTIPFPLLHLIDTAPISQTYMPPTLLHPNTCLRSTGEWRGVITPSAT